MLKDKFLPSSIFFQATHYKGLNALTRLLWSTQTHTQIEQECSTTLQSKKMFQAGQLFDKSRYLLAHCGALDKNVVYCQPRGLDS